LEGLFFGKWRSFIPGPNADDLNPAVDNNDHGTRVASLAGARASFVGGGEGIAGIGRVAIPVSLKVETRNSLHPDQVNAALDYGSGTGTSQGQLKILNLSLGFYRSQFPSEAIFRLMARTCKGAYGRGALLVSSSGNSFFDGDTQPNFIKYPAGFGDIVMAIGATAWTDRIWRSNDLFGFNPANTTGSTYGSFLSMVAPGAGITNEAADLTVSSIDAANCDYSETGLAKMTGTSFAAPLIAGAAAWLLEIQPTLTNDDLRQVLERSAVDLGAGGVDPEYGHGLLDLKQAARMVSSPNWIEHGAIGAGTATPLNIGPPTNVTLHIISYPDDPTLVGDHPAVRFKLSNNAVFSTYWLYRPTVWARRRECNGIDGTGTWDDDFRLPWADVGPPLPDVTTYRALYTYVYQLTDRAGQWFPCSPASAKIAWTAIGEVQSTAVGPRSRNRLMLTPRGNPTRGSVVLGIEGLAIGPLRAEIFDLAGRLQSKMFEGATTRTNLELTWDGRFWRGGRVAPGVYLCRVEQPGQRSVCRVTLLR
jgi:hypothetical protein